MKKFHIAGFIACAVMAMSLVACSDEDTSDQQVQSGQVQQVADQQDDSSPDGWVVTAEEPGVSHTYTSDGDVTYDPNVHAYHFVDATTGKTVYVSDRYAVSMVER